MNLDECIKFLESTAGQYRNKLALIQETIYQQTQAPIGMKQRTFLVFLDRERSVYQFALTEAESFISLMRHNGEAR